MLYLTVDFFVSFLQIYKFPVRLSTSFELKKKHTSLESTGTEDLEKKAYLKKLQRVFSIPQVSKHVERYRRKTRGEGVIAAIEM